MVRIRMKSFGRRHRPFFRICVMDARTPRDGRAIEELGHYDPMVRNAESREVLKVSRIRYWLSVGAQPSEKVQAILKRHGIKKPAPGEPWEVAEPEAPAPTQAPGVLKTTATPTPQARPAATAAATATATAPEAEAPAQAAAPTDPPASTIPPEPGPEQP